MEFRYAFLAYVTVPNVCLIWVIRLKSFGILYHHLWYKYSRLILWLLLAFLTSSRKTGQFPFYWPDFSWWKHFPSLLMSPWVSIHFPLVLVLPLTFDLITFLSFRFADSIEWIWIHPFVLLSAVLNMLSNCDKVLLISFIMNGLKLSFSFQCIFPFGFWSYHYPLTLPFLFFSLRGLDRMDLYPSFYVTFGSSQLA